MLLSPATTLPLITYGAIMQEDLQPIDWLVQDLFAHGDRVIVYGEPGSYKSWLLLHLALHIAAGKKWLEELSVPQATGVLYVDEEMSARLLRRRIKRLGLGANLEDMGLPFQALSQRGIKLDEHGAERLLSVLEENAFSPEVIIIETMRRVLIGSELSAEDVGKFWQNLQPLRQAGKTVIVSHHMRKPSPHGGNDTRYRASGSTDILGGADTVFSITSRARNTLEVKCEKSRNAEEPPIFQVSLHDQGHESPLAMQFEGYLGIASATPGETGEAVRLIVEYLAQAHDWTAMTSELKAHVIAQGGAERTYERAWAQVRDRNMVASLTYRKWQLREQYRRPIAMAP